jgi:hypothetical protein
MLILDIEEIKKTSAKQPNWHITREFENDTFSSDYSNTGNLHLTQNLIVGKCRPHQKVEKQQA